MKDKSRKKNFFDLRKEAIKPDTNLKPNNPNQSPRGTILAAMEDGREFESLTKSRFVGINAIQEIQASIQEIEAARKRPAICMIANTIVGGPGTMIDDADELPFEEMLNQIPPDIKEIDVIIQTGGGLATTVDKLVSRLRPRFDHVGFIILNKAMSAGTMFAMSGDEIIMNSSSQIGPIDPQVRRMNGTFLPAQAISILIAQVQKRGQERLDRKQPIDWTDQLLIQSMDRMEAGNALSMSEKSIELVESYLEKYKFKHWHKHSSTGLPVTPEERKEKANEIAGLLCNHDKWKDHSHAINRVAAWEECKLQIIESESIEGLDRAIRRMWALFYFLFMSNSIQKAYVSSDYGVLRTYKQPNEK